MNEKTQQTIKDQGPTPYTPGIKTLLGDPKKLILKLSIPIIIAISTQIIYNFTDAIFVSGLGNDALSAVGFFFPIMILVMALSMGLGVGGSVIISQKIGAHNKSEADKTAVHTLLMMSVLAAVITIPFLIFIRPIFKLLGAGPVLELTVAYSKIMLYSVPLHIFCNVTSSILRSEGDVKRVSIAMFFSTILNIALDPLFIYTFNWGIEGAAWASVIATAFTSSLFYFWLFIKRDNYVSLTFKNTRFEKKIFLDITRIGLPASLNQVSTAIMMLMITVIIAKYISTDGIAVFSAGGRIMRFAVIPLSGFSYAMITLAGVSFGARDYAKLHTGFSYALKLTIIIELVIGVMFFWAAPYMAKIFDWSGKTASIYNDLVLFLKIISFSYPVMVFGFISGALFQGVGKSGRVLVITIAQSFVFTIIFVLLFAFVFNLGLAGVWIGMSVAGLITGIIAFFWAKSFLASLHKSEQK